MCGVLYIGNELIVLFRRQNSAHCFFFFLLFLCFSILSRLFFFVYFLPLLFFSYLLSSLPFLVLSVYVQQYTWCQVHEYRGCSCSIWYSVFRISLQAMRDGILVPQLVFIEYRSLAYSCDCGALVLVFYSFFTLFFSDRDGICSLARGK